MLTQYSALTQRTVEAASRITDLSCEPQKLFVPRIAEASRLAHHTLLFGIRCVPPLRQCYCLESSESSSSPKIPEKIPPSSSSVFSWLKYCLRVRRSSTNAMMRHRMMPPMNRQATPARVSKSQLKKSMVNLSVQDVPNGRVAPLLQEARGSIQQVVVASIY